MTIGLNIKFEAFYSGYFEIAYMTEQKILAKSGRFFNLAFV